MRQRNLEKLYFSVRQNLANEVGETISADSITMQIHVDFSLELG